MPHVTGYVDLAHCIDGGAGVDCPYPLVVWWASPEPWPALSDCRRLLESCLEPLAQEGIGLGCITSGQIFSALNKWYRLDTALRRIIQQLSPGRSQAVNVVKSKVSTWVLGDRAVFPLSVRSNAKEIDEVLQLEDGGEKRLSLEEASYLREAVVALRLAKDVLEMRLRWRANAIAELNRRKGSSRSLANACTDWPCLLIELLSQSAGINHFQPKLVTNNNENAILRDDTTVPGPLYHDSFISRIIVTGANERCLSVNSFADCSLEIFDDPCTGALLEVSLLYAE